MGSNLVTPILMLLLYGPKVSFLYGSQNKSKRLNYFSEILCFKKIYKKNQSHFLDLSYL